MPYLQVDLDGKKKMPAAARLAGITEAQVAWGLLELWEWCWTAGTDAVGLDQLEGLFGCPGQAIARALMAFDFIESMEAGFRVRGAARYLRISEAKASAGRTRASGARRDQQGRLMPSGKPAGAGPATSENPALTPIIEHQSPIIEKKNIEPAARAPRETDSICAAFLKITGSKYHWQKAKDGTAFAALRKTETLPRILEVWEFALRAEGWLHVATVAQLAGQKWNDLVAALGGQKPIPLEVPCRSRGCEYAVGRQTLGTGLCEKHFYSFRGDDNDFPMAGTKDFNAALTEFLGRTG